MSQYIAFSNNPTSELQRILGERPAKGVFVVADSNTSAIARRLIAATPALSAARLIEIAAGDENKTLGALQGVWDAMEEGGATRHSMVINVGGGMTTDLGGMAAATFKRGVRFVNVPTSLLGAVDAAVGGKTGVNYRGLKNEIGVFAEAEEVIVSSCYFDTLPAGELMSGYAEMLKHGLLKSDQAIDRLLRFDPEQADGSARLLELLRESVEVKRGIVAADPHEHGLRKSLNLGHTIGHAFEGMALAKGVQPPAHGHAVAWGLVCDLALSHFIHGFPAERLKQVAEYVERHYPQPTIGCADYPALIELMRHDKKNLDTDSINFTLLRRPGDVVTDCTVDTKDIAVGLDLMRDLLHV